MGCVSFPVNEMKKPANTCRRVVFSFGLEARFDLFERLVHAGFPILRHRALEVTS